MKYIFVALFLLPALQGWAQSAAPDLQNPGLWQVRGRKITAIDNHGKSGVAFDAGPGAGMMVLKNYNFSEGVLEFDLKGKNVLQKSFVGIAFHVQNDSIYDVVYFRPFNFLNEDTLRRRRAVQYVSVPAYDWFKLRADHPGKYENRVDPVPNPEEWFHVKVVVRGKKVQVFVNNAPKPSLEVEKLTASAGGGLGLWVGEASDGSFSNLVVTPEPPGGNTSKAGKN